MKKTIVIIFILIVFIVIFFFINKKDEKNIQTINVGYFLNITHPQAILGFDRGDFQKAFGNNIKLNKYIFNAGPAEVQAFMAGELDLGYIGPGPALNAFSKSGGDIVIIAGACQSGSLFAIQPDTSIKELADLKGKIVATPQFGNTQDLIFKYLLRQANLKDSLHGGDVEVINISPAAIYTLFKQKQVDAALVPEPWGSKLVLEAGAKKFQDKDEVYRNGDYPVTVLIARKTFVQKYPNLVKQWLKVHIALTKEISQNSDGVKKSFIHELEKKSGKNVTLTKEVLDTAFTKIKPINNINLEAMNDFAKLLYDEKYVHYKIDLDKAIDLHLLKEVK